MSDILKAASKFKTKLLRENDKALKQMVLVYGKSWNKLRHELEEVTRKIEAAKKAGELVNPSWLYRQDRYIHLMWQCEQELVVCSKYASGLVGLQQEMALMLGQEHSKRLMDMSVGVMPKELVESGYSVTWNLAHHSAVINLVGYLADGSPLAYKFDGMASATVQGIRDIMVTSIAAGENPRTIARQVQKAFNGAMSNALTVCRTEVMRAYRQASIENYRANNDIVTGYIRTCAHSANTCAGCWAVDGKFYQLSTDFDDHPNGRCAIIPVCKTWQELFPGRDLSHIPETSVKPWDSEQYFSKLSKAEQRKVLGNTKYNLYAAGKIKLSDMATLRQSPVWGDSYQPTSISDLIRLGKVSTAEVREARAS